MKKQKQLAKRVNEEAMKRFQDHKDEQISKRFVHCYNSIALLLVILSPPDLSCRPMLPTNMSRLSREMLRSRTFAFLLVNSPQHRTFVI